MSDLKKLGVGIVLVAIGIAMLLSSGGGIIPALGAIIGVVGAAMIVFALTAGWFQKRN